MIRKSFIAAFLVSTGVVALMTPIVLGLARKYRLFDAPDAERKVHLQPTPRLGGLAIGLGILLPIGALGFYGNDFSSELHGDAGRLVAFFGGALAILALGVFDDLHGVGAWGKLGVQSLVALLLWESDLRVHSVSLFDTPVELGLWSLPLTWLWVCGFINAMNLIDGLDGLAAGVAFFASVSLFAIAQFDGIGFLALMAATTAGAALGFLIFNFSPALIFMGDSGSMLFGYVFAVSGLWTASKRASLMALALPMMALGVPLFDTTFAFLRRALAGNSPFHSDRRHIHHQLVDFGLSHRQAVLLLYLLCSMLTVGAVAMRAMDDYRIALWLGLLAVVTAVSLRRILRRRSQTDDPM
ncbi:MAG: undecaprenyl/decaprenyl-phosphate alpha-N-acetylglucosaminyl 1-phosphate transferase [Deltaproteobacteria bacterium]|nr:undecaprenyl/decaprenyl-phosphate alpha-N-acetylglucosaminyl 1-phosphate transferase [Deltaproteobacteria bacterium]